MSLWKEKWEGPVRDAQLCFSANETWSFYYSFLVSKPQARSHSVGNVGHVAQKRNGQDVEKVKSDRRF